MRYEVEVTANAGYIISVEAETELEACEYAEDLVRQGINGAIWINLESLSLPMQDDL
jgi:hypothetical protein